MFDFTSKLCYHAQNTAYSMPTFKRAVSMGSGNGSCKPKNLEDGADSKTKVEVMRQFCFVTEVRGLAKHLSGNRNYS